MAHYNVFRQQLAIKYPAIGHALWEPRPGIGHECVQIGDVGFIREGQFHRLFNALLPEDHPSHRKFGVPPYHELLVPSVSDHINRGVLSRNHYCSAGITMDTEPDRHASKPPDFPEVSFSCTRQQGGAVLSIPVQAQRQNTLALGDFGRWMVKHIDRWFAFAQRLGLGIVHMEEIVLITGCDCTRSWTNVAFLEGQGDDAQASFGVELVDGHGPDASIKWHFSPERIRGALLNQGPEGKTLPENQCIFIRGFRVARILKILPKHLKAAAGPSSDADENYKEPGSDSELIPVPLTTGPEYRDPLHLLLDYVADIGQQALDCDLAIVHDDDLTQIDGICDGTDLHPDVVMGHLRRSNLDVHQVPCNLSPTQKDFNTSTEMVGVATLSATLYNKNPASRPQITSIEFQMMLGDWQLDLTKGETASMSEIAPVVGKRNIERPPKHNNALYENARGELELPVRKRGRPPKPKPTSSHEDVGEGSTSDFPAKRKRGRPPKPTSPHEDVGEGSTSNFPAKRKRGMPPKPKRTSPHEDVGEGGTSDFPAKRKRGRPSKSPA